MLERPAQLPSYPSLPRKARNRRNGGNQGGPGRAPEPRQLAKRGIRTQSDPEYSGRLHDASAATFATVAMGRCTILHCAPVAGPSVGGEGEIISATMNYDWLDRMRPATWLFVVCLNAGFAYCQTTLGIVSGRVFDQQSKAGIGAATVTYTSLDSNETGSVRSTSRGNYGIPFLSPGRYRVRAEAAGYQPQTLQSMDLQVAGRVELNFPLRSFAELRQKGLYNGSGGVSIAGQREVVDFFGPDVGFAAPLQVLQPEAGTLQPSLSYVLESDEINRLPLSGRDPYSLLLTLPGASSDTATALSLSLSINGQRPTSSNFLLDGVENNDTTNTGPRVLVAPDLVDSYRVSTNNFSAEFGGTSGFVANAVTKAGSNTFHGTAYAYLGNDILNANSFQNNLNGITRRADKELYAGYWLGGPIRKNRLWFSSGFERLRDRSTEPPRRTT